MDNKRKWVNSDSMYGPGTLPPFLGLEGGKTQSKRPIDYFLFYFSDEILEEIVFQSNLYAHQLDKPNFTLTKYELQTFLGINLIMSYIRYPRTRLYWNSDAAFRMSFIADSMPVNRYESILRHLHFTNNLDLDTNSTDKLKKLRPFLDKLQKNFLSATEPEEYQAINEQIVPLKGRLSIKQYLPKKPKKWGVKIWVRAGVSGYMYRFEVYQGAGGGREAISDFGACGDVILRLSDDIQHKNHKLFFDNLFCSVPLLQELKQRKIWATGTLRGNRLSGAGECLMSEKDMKKQGRGTSSVVSTESGDITITKWMDSNAIHIGSTCAGVEPQSSVKRWSKPNKTTIEVNRPFSVKYYNKNMGGVDLLDQLLALYPLRRRNKRWYIRIFMHFLDVAVINSWILYKKDGNSDMDLLEFKGSVGRTLINRGTRNSENKRGRPRSTTPPTSILKTRKPNHHAPEEIRKDNFGHWPKLTDIKNARRCHSSSCKRKTKDICKRCNEPCCPDCMENFHK
ncbi:hypothetical protein PPYR_15415 [Photinus pyralis]|uniref:PiggyBac transposable element-derived protein domain-containing protein n=1 Tax=Photinus pyralis TaxID=7054 RepID=A0A5N4A0C3_PHOPY|nr:hypothetical protein PPYR_15415 [Photinus pyralis]